MPHLCHAVSSWCGCNPHLCLWRCWKTVKKFMQLGALLFIQPLTALLIQVINSISSFDGGWSMGLQWCGASFNWQHPCFPWESACVHVLAVKPPLTQSSSFPALGCEAEVGSAWRLNGRLCQSSSQQVSFCYLTISTLHQPTLGHNSKTVGAFQMSIWAKMFSWPPALGSNKDLEPFDPKAPNWF